MTESKSLKRSIIKVLLKNTQSTLKILHNCNCMPAKDKEPIVIPVPASKNKKHMLKSPNTSKVELTENSAQKSVT